MNYKQFAQWLFFAIVFTAAGMSCHKSAWIAGASPDSDTDTDSDTDNDSDTATDSDIDNDTDTDTDTDTACVLS